MTPAMIYALSAMRAATQQDIENLNKLMEAGVIDALATGPAPAAPPTDVAVEGEASPARLTR